MKIKIIFSLFFLSFIFSSPSSLYKSINPKSISKHLIFYKLYPDTKEGKMALEDAYNLLNTKVEKNSLFNININFLVDIILRKKKIKKIDEKDLKIIEKISKDLKNRKLKTFNKTKEELFLNAKPKEIDIARAIFIAQNKSLEEIKYYEAYLDLLSLQIKAMFDKNMPDIEKIKTINNFIFFDMQFKFPSLSDSAKTKTYTSLASVIDKKEGICLGLCILYLAIAQRLGIDIKAITIPGHIFLRYKDELNIETTARGVHILDEDYLSINIESLQKRNNKEVIALAFINDAAFFLKEKDYLNAKKCYEKALKYMPNDPLLKQLFGFCCLFSKDKKGIKYLKEIADKKFPYYTYKEILAKDFLDKKIDINGIKEIFLDFADTRKELLLKKENLNKILKKYPNFRMGLLLVANIQSNLGRTKEALRILKKYFNIDPSNPNVTFYISQLSFQRYNFKNAWKFLNLTKSLLQTNPKAVKNFKNILNKTCLH